MITNAVHNDIIILLSFSCPLKFLPGQNKQKAIHKILQRTHKAKQTVFNIWGEKRFKLKDDSAALISMKIQQRIIP